MLILGAADSLGGGILGLFVRFPDRFPLSLALPAFRTILWLSSLMLQ